MKQLPDSYFTLSRFIRANWFWLLILIIIGAIAFASEAQNQPYAVWKIEGRGFDSIKAVNAPLPPSEYAMYWDSVTGYEYPSDRAFVHWFSLIMSDNSIMHFWHNSEACLAWWTDKDVLGTDGQPHPTRGGHVYDCERLEAWLIDIE